MLQPVVRIIIRDVIQHVRRIMFLFVEKSIFRVILQFQYTTHSLYQ